MTPAGIRSFFSAPNRVLETRQLVDYPHGDIHHILSMMATPSRHPSAEHSILLCTRCRVGGTSRSSLLSVHP